MNLGPDIHSSVSCDSVSYPLQQVDTAELIVRFSYPF